MSTHTKSAHGDNMSSVFVPPPTTIYQPAPPRKRCSRTCCFVGTAVGVIVGLMVLGVIIYVVMVVESQCYRGCQRMCTTESHCVDNCWSICWKAQWTKCPEDGAKACAYILWDKAVINIGGLFGKKK